MTLEILDSNGIMTLKIMKAINKKVAHEEVLHKKLYKLSLKLYDLIYQKFLESETYASLAGGILRAEFGLDDKEVANLPEILRQIVSVAAVVEKNGQKVTIHINMCENDVDLSSVGTYVSESKRGSFLINWLYWLLIQGERVVVPEFSIWLKPGAGRSEMAFMFLPEDGGYYSVDGQFSGVFGDNWVTRTLRDNREEISKMISRTMNNRMKK